MRKYQIAALTAGLGLAGGCKDSPFVAPVDLPTVDAVQGTLTRAGLQTLALGVLAADRAGIGGAANYSYLVIPAIYARDAFRIDASEARYVTETLTGAPDPGSFAGGGGFTFFYVATRAANSLVTSLNALGPTDTQQISVAEKNAALGFARTMKALDTYRVIELRDTVGVVIQGADASVVDPIVCKATAINYVAALLDSANADFTAAGPATRLPFTLPTGFQASGPGGINYQTVANFAALNRGLKGKVDLYRGIMRPAPVASAIPAAITELTAFLGGAAAGAVPASQFGRGAYVTFVSGGTENTPNPISDARIGVNPLAVNALEAGDTRAAKIVTRPGASPTLSGNGVSTTVTFVGASVANAANAIRPNAILRYEEAVLLRAQAYFEAGNFAAGYADLNSVRTSYGLAARPVQTVLATARQHALYEKRYSLFFEGPQRLVDLRAYGVRAEAIGVAGEVFNTALPIPKVESDARGGNIAPVCP